MIEDQQTESLMLTTDGIDLKAFHSDRFKIVSILGSGGMATVYEAYDAILEQHVAIKILHAQLTEPHVVGRFRREIQLSRKIAHPNVLKLYDAVKVMDKIGVTMELVKGGALCDYMTRLDDVSYEKCLDLFRQIVDGLDAAHQLGILHRDLKPQNILMVSEETIKIADFGLAYSLLDTGPALTLEGSVGGTPAYMAPEVIKGDFYDPRSDIYSLGIIAYELFTGKSPYHGASVYQLFQEHLYKEVIPPLKVKSTLPRFVDEVIMRCLQKNPESRFQSTSELKQCLKTFDGKQELLVPHDGKREKQDGLSPMDSVRDLSQQNQPNLCHACGERVPPQFINCPFCSNKPLQSLGQGEWSVILLPPKKSSIRHRMIQEFTGESLGFYPRKTIHEIILLLRQAGFGHGIDVADLGNSIGQCPNVLLENVSKDDALDFQEKLIERGIKAEVKRLTKTSLYFSRKTKIQNLAKISSALTGIFSFTFLLLFPAEAILLGISGISFMLYWKMLKYPVANVSKMFDSEQKKEQIALSKETFALAHDILPQLRDESIRTISIGLMKRAADVQYHTKSDPRINPDEWIQHGLKLALKSQQAREERLQGVEENRNHFIENEQTFEPEHEQKNVILERVTETARTFDPEQRKMINGKDGVEAPVSMDEETRALSSLLRIRAQVDMLASQYELLQSQQELDTLDIDDLLMNLQAETEAFIEVEKM